MIIIEYQIEKNLYHKLFWFTNNLNPIKKYIYNQKINQLTIEDLMHYSLKYNVELSLDQAKSIYRILKRNRINIDDNAQLIRIINEINKKITHNVREKIIYLIEQL